MGEIRRNQIEEIRQILKKNTLADVVKIIEILFPEEKERKSLNLTYHVFYFLKMIFFEKGNIYNFEINLKKYPEEIKSEFFIYLEKKMEDSWEIFKKNHKNHTDDLFSNFEEEYKTDCRKLFERIWEIFYTYKSGKTQEEIEKEKRNREIGEQTLEKLKSSFK